MKISFFEEFPTKENLLKLKLLTWQAKLYLAAKSLDEFNAIKDNIKNRHVREFVYWPILERSEGYWISPFSQTKALRRIFNQLDYQNAPIMLDLELPTTQNPLLYGTQWLHFWRNKRAIQTFLTQYQGKKYLAEYYPKENKLLKLMGLHFEGEDRYIIKMLYHSLHNFSHDFLQRELQQGVQQWGQHFIAAFGTIAPGIHGSEPILSLQQLEHDLQIAEKSGVNEVIIFRLGGLNKDYVRVLQKFSA